MGTTFFLEAIRLLQENEMPLWMEWRRINYCGYIKNSNVNQAK